MQQDSKTLTSIVHRDVLVEQIKAVVGIEYEGVAPAVLVRGLVQLLEERNGILCFLGGEWYGFMHRTFLEYFCATAIKELWLRREITDDKLLGLFQDHCLDPSWSEVLVMTSGLVPGKFIGPCLVAMVRAAANVQPRKEQGWAVLLALRCAEALDKRDEAVKALVEIRETALDMVLSASSVEIQAEMVALVASLWQDNDVCGLLIQVATAGGNGAIAAVQALASKFPATDELRAVLIGVVKAGGDCASAAVKALASKFPATDELRAVLSEVAKREGPQGDLANDNLRVLTFSSAVISLV
jgi:hypothetical protein